jgi:hypothetical protein
MRIHSAAIVSNSEITANYKSCRDKAEHMGKIFIFKNNQPDAVMFPIAEYERLSSVIEYLDDLDKNETEEFLKTIANHVKKKT